MAPQLKPGCAAMPIVKLALASLVEQTAQYLVPPVRPAPRVAVGPLEAVDTTQLVVVAHAPEVRMMTTLPEPVRLHVRSTVQVVVGLKQMTTS